MFKKRFIFTAGNNDLDGVKQLGLFKETVDNEIKPANPFSRCQEKWLIFLGLTQVFSARKKGAREELLRVLAG